MDLNCTFGGEFEAEASRQFIDAWHRAECGETFCEHHRAFEIRNALARTGEPHAIREEEPNSSRQAGVIREADRN
jgi:hypothetical protein